MGNNRVFIATSLDGYIAGENGDISWLHSIPNPDNIDMGYADFMAQVDALVMGRNTFETVCGFDIDWPYNKPVFVLSNKLSEIPLKYEGKAFLVNGSLNEVLAKIHKKGYKELYIDGGTTIRNFLKEDLIDEIIITTIPIMLGNGVPLFSSLNRQLQFECRESKIYLKKIVQNSFKRVRGN